MRWRNIIMVWVVLSLTTGFAWARVAPQDSTTGPQKTWIAPPVQEQLQREAQDGEKGLGRLFVPVMSVPAWAPGYDVYQNGKKIYTEKPMGESLFLAPGQYRILIGSASSRSDQIEKNVQIKDGQTTVVKPDWSGLVLRFVSSVRKYLRVHYEIYRLDNRESVGIGISRDETRINEFPETWILKPGYYKIVKAGYPFDSATNFATVRLLPGELVQYSIVADEFSHNFLASGIMPELGRVSSYISNFNYYSMLSGGLNYVNNNLINSNSFSYDINLSAKLDNRFLYDHRSHYYLGEFYYELFMNQKEGEEPRIFSDEFDVRNLYIYYLFSEVGIYTRANMRTRFFDKYNYFEEEVDITIESSDGTTVGSKNQVSQLKVSSPLSPMIIKEGVGLNYTPFRRQSFQIGFGTGLGFRQYLYQNALEQDQDNEFLYRQIESQMLNGWEIQSRLNARIWERITWSLQFDILFPFVESGKIDYEIENVLNFRVWKYINFEYTFRYIKEFGRSYGLIENNMWLRLSYIF